MSIGPYKFVDSAACSRWLDMAALYSALQDLYDHSKVIQNFSQKKKRTAIVRRITTTFDYVAKQL